MEPVTLVLLAWAFFGGTHLGLTTRRVRGALVARFGEGGYRTLFSVVAAVSFTVLARTYAAHAHDGPPGMGAALNPMLRLLLAGVVALGATLMVAGFVAYPGSPMELGRRNVPRPTPLARITRHSFFAGLAIVAIGHTVLATHLVGTVFFAILGAVTIVGAWHQDRRLLAERGEAYAAYCRETSAVPFAALLARRTRLGAGELPVVPLAVGVAGAAALRLVHPYLFAWDGMAVAIAVVGGALFFAVTALVRSAVRAGHGRALATAGGMLVLEVGLAHEIVGARLYPDGPALLGGAVAWHAVGLAGIAIGAIMTGGALGFTAMPPRALATALIGLGVAFIALDAVLHGGFHFFAATLIVGAWLVRSGWPLDQTAASRHAAAVR